jgi:hypothetical protein
LDIEIKEPDPDKPDAGIITSQQVVPGLGIERRQDDLMRKAADPSDPVPASEATMDDSAEALSDE